MMTVIGFLLVAVVTMVFILMAIAPMIAEPRSSGTVRRADIVPIAPPAAGERDMHRADAA